MDKVESLEFQEEFLRQYCERQGFAIGEVIGDPMTSARKIPLRKRPGGQRLLELTTGKNPAYRIVAAYRLDRLFRSIVDGVQTIAAWDRAGAAMHLAAEDGQAINTKTATGKMIVHMRLVINQYEGDTIAERTSQAMQRMGRNGRKMGGVPPYGMRLIDGKWIEDREEAEAVREILALSQTMSPRMVARILDERGMPCRGGKRWHHVTIRRILERATRQT